MVENSWNGWFRLMYKLLRNTHRYFVEPISGVKHIKCALIKNCLNFIEQIKRSDKSVSKALLNTIMLDVKSVTESNLRKKLILWIRTQSVNRLLKTQDCYPTIQYLLERSGKYLWKYVYRFLYVILYIHINLYLHELLI